MSKVQREDGGAAAVSAPPFADPDRTTRARIRDAALARFAAEGVGKATIKAIAADAGVSAQLVVHHFGSKDGLAGACDEYVRDKIREQKQSAMAAGPAAADLFQTLRDRQDDGAVLAYLARRLVDDSPHVDRLVDEAVEDAVAYSEEGVRSGFLTELALSREHVIVLVLWGMGAAVLHRHAKRLLGADILTGSAQEQLAYIVPATEILAKGIISAEALDRLHAATDDPTRSNS